MEAWIVGCLIFVFFALIEYGALLKVMSSTKGQLISKCLYEISVSSKIPTKLFLDFCPEIFCTFLGASWKLLGLPVGFLIYNIN
jgi:hypothetical protein